MFEQWQPWWDVVLLIVACGILTPVFIYIDKKEGKNENRST